MICYAMIMGRVLVYAERCCGISRCAALYGENTRNVSTGAAQQRAEYV